MKCIIIDDEKLAREILSILILKSPNLVLVDQFSNAMEAIKYLNNNTVDLIFLDIHMPNFSGFDFVQTIKNPPQIILVTTDHNFALEAFNYDCITDYLVKPIIENRFNRAIERVHQKSEKINKATSVIDTETKEIYVNIDKRLIKIDMATINTIQANGDYIIVKTDLQNYTVHTTLKKIEDKLPKTIFLKIHRSYIINISKIIDIQDSSVLIGKEIIPVSKNNRSELMQHLNLL
ncbi:LytR/AlgR family response regulator transcription factor [Flavobacterium sp.]|uniref:LytR/AlgR family response regulator transcription factor n=1 Tax=Flavobacterium sp. TaxID=239 RepID=UPI003752A5BC